MLKTEDCFIFYELVRQINILVLVVLVLDVDVLVVLVVAVVVVEAINRNLLSFET